MPIEPGNKRRIAYDWDDVNFCWILVRGERGGYKVVRTELSDDPADCCCPPEKSLYVIPPLAKLPEAPSELVKAVKD